MGISGRRYRVTVSNSLGSRTSHQAVLTIEPLPPVFWEGLPRDAAGNFHSPWFGAMADLSTSPLYFHFQHGWISSAGDSTATLYWYDFQSGDWFMTTPDTYPIVYRFGADSGWYGYRRGGGREGYRLTPQPH